VALRAEKVRDHIDSEVLSASPLAYRLRLDDRDFVVFCFAKAEEAEAFAKRFGGKRLPESQR
jgi:hypothetical protein